MSSANEECDFFPPSLSAFSCLSKQLGFSGLLCRRWKKQTCCVTPTSGKGQGPNLDLSCMLSKVTSDIAASATYNTGLFLACSDHGVAGSTNGTDGDTGYLPKSDDTGFKAK